MRAASFSFSSVPDKCDCSFTFYFFACEMLSSCDIADTWNKLSGPRPPNPISCSLPHVESTKVLAKPHVQVDKSNPVSEAVEIVVCTLYETKLMLAM
jgi:hypothetical protein